MKDRFLIDSNVLVYAFDEAEKHKKERARELLKRAVNEGGCCLSAQNLSEFHSVVTGNIERKISPEKSLEIITDFGRNFSIFNYGGNTVIEAINTQLIYKAPYWDALIAATMKENGVKIIYTEDEKGFKNMPWLTVINPFK